MIKQTLLQQLRSAYLQGNESRFRILLNEATQKGYPSSLLGCFKPKVARKDVEKYVKDLISSIDADSSLGVVSPTPMVSIIIVSYNSRNHLVELLPTICAQSYKNYELIIVENGSEDSAWVGDLFPGRFKYIAADNPGFAEANNLALEVASGELLFLLNPDTTLHEDALKQMVHALSVDASAAAVSPLIYFYKPFYRLRIEVPSDISIAVNLSSSISGLSYKKIFVVEGQELLDGWVQSSKDGNIIVEIPLKDDLDNLSVPVRVEGQLLSQKLIKCFFEGSGNPARILTLSDENCSTLGISLSLQDHSASRYLVNNAGSGINHDGMPYDIGFGQVCCGQFLGKAYRDAFCGCAVLLRKQLFVARKIFISEFFAYYEDSELSFWLRQSGLRILYVSSAIVFHRHSESTKAHSPLWDLLVNRSRAIYEAIVKSADDAILFDDSNSQILYRELPFEASELSVKDKLMQLDESLLGRTRGSLILRGHQKKVGIYNSYWTTLGGGEKHALDIAAMASSLNHEVFLIAESDFDLPSLLSYFGFSGLCVKKLIVGTVSTWLTSQFDIFVNSTYRSTLHSACPNSYYIVSFPDPNLPNEIKGNYTFLHNSPFTARWASRYWGQHKNFVLLPVIGFARQISRLTGWSAGYSGIALHPNALPAKSKSLLCVGRFNYCGHCKNQHIVAAEFASMQKRGDISFDWKLLFVGSCNFSEASSVKHLEDSKRAAGDANVEFFVNASRQSVIDLYRQASVYVHAAGLGVNSDANPHELEHFGIAVYEALINGCIPVVYNEGGPAAQIDGVSPAFTYKTQNELAAGMAAAIEHAENLLEDTCASRERHRLFWEHASDMAYDSAKLAENILLDD